MDEILRWVGGSAVVIVSVLYIVWLVFVIIQKIATLGWWRAFEVVVVGVILFYAATKFLFPMVDNAYAREVKPQVQQSIMLHDITGVLGASQMMGFNGQGSGLPAAQPTQDKPAIAQSGGGQAAPVVPQAQPAVVAQFPSYFVATSIKVGKAKKDVCGWASPTTLILCNDADQPSGDTIVVDPSKYNLPSPQTVVIQPTPVPQVVLPTPVPTPTVTRVQWFKILGVCWLQWANAQGLTTTQASWGLMALPAGTSWSLQGPGSWVAFWNNRSKEQWFLSSSDLGIQGYMINGYLARSFPGNDISSTILLRGTNTDFFSACGLPQTPPER